jgi:hypothetical protein
MCGAFDVGGKMSGEDTRAKKADGQFSHKSLKGNERPDT